MRTSTDRSKASSALPLAKSSKRSRVSTLPAFSANARSSANSYDVRANNWPSSVARKLALSTITRPTLTSRARTSAAFGTAHDGLDTRQQLARGKWLGHVIVGAELEPEHAICNLDASGDGNDRHVRMLADLATNFEAALSGKHQVQHHGVELRPQRFASCGHAVAHQGDVEAVLFQVVAGQTGDFCVVFDHQNLEPRAFHLPRSVHERPNRRRGKHNPTQKR